MKDGDELQEEKKFCGCKERAENFREAETRELHPCLSLIPVLGDPC